MFPSSLSSLVKSADTGNGVTFHSGDNVDLGQSHIGVSFIDTAMQMVRPAWTCLFRCTFSVCVERDVKDLEGKRGVISSTWMEGWMVSWIDGWMD